MFELLFCRDCIRERIKEQAGLNKNQGEKKETSRTKPKIKERRKKQKLCLIQF